MHWTQGDNTPLPPSLRIRAVLNSQSAASSYATERCSLNWTQIESKVNYREIEV